MRDPTRLGASGPRVEAARRQARRTNYPDLSPSPSPRPTITVTVRAADAWPEWTDFDRWVPEPGDLPRPSGPGRGHR